MPDLKTPRRLLARFFAWAYEIVRIEHPDEPDMTILSTSFKSFGEKGWAADLTVQSEASKWLAFTMAAMVHDAPNFVTGGFSLRTVDGLNVYELTVRRCIPGGKTPQVRIAELEAERDSLLETRQAA